MLIKEIDDQGVIRLTKSEIDEFKGSRVGLVRVNNNYEIFKQLQELFAGEAEKAGFKTEQELQNYMLEIRKEVRGY